MCTVSLVVRSGGYLLAMNRDERIARGPGSPPKLSSVSGIAMVFPSEPGGGTWIGANQNGLTLALLNWNDLPPEPADPMVVRQSRGIVIPQLIGSQTATELRFRLRALQLAGCAPFRLAAILGHERQVFEAWWNGRRLTCEPAGWNSRHWFSSSLSDSEAQTLRGAACAHAWNASDAGSVAWLRRLHASHGHGLSPFSICVHRESVATLSYTEVACTTDRICLRHSVGNPCQPSESHTLELRRIDSGFCSLLAILPHVCEVQHVG